MSVNTWIKMLQNWKKYFIFVKHAKEGRPISDLLYYIHLIQMKWIHFTYFRTQHNPLTHLKPVGEGKTQTAQIF